MASVQTFGPAQPYKTPEVFNPVDLLQAQALQQRNALMGAEVLQTSQQNQLRAQQIQDANVLRSLASQPGSFNPDGSATNALIANVAQSGNVTAINALTKHQADIEAKKAVAAKNIADAEERTNKIRKEYGEVIDEAMGKVGRLDETLTDHGMPADQKAQELNATWNEQLDDWRKTNGVPPEVLDKAPKQYDADKFKAMSNAYQKWKQANEKQDNTGATILRDPSGDFYKIGKTGGAEGFFTPEKKWVPLTDGKIPSDAMPVNQPSIQLVQQRAEAAAAGRLPAQEELQQQRIVSGVVKEDQRRLDKFAKDYAIPAYKQSETIANRAESQLTDPKTGYQSVTPEQARALVNQAKLMMDNYRSRTGGKYQDDQVNRMNSLIERVGKYVQTIGEGEKILAKDEMLNLTKEMKNIYADRNADLLRKELDVAHSTALKGGNPSQLTMQGRIDDAVKYGKAKKTNVDGVDYLVFGEKGKPLSKDDMYPLPAKE